VCLAGVQEDAASVAEHRGYRVPANAFGALLGPQPGPDGARQDRAQDCGQHGHRDRAPARAPNRARQGARKLPPLLPAPWWVQHQL